jgi:hypothetical protein
MVLIDYDFVGAANLREIADNITAFFKDNAIDVQTGVVRPEDTPSFLVITPAQDSSIAQMGAMLDTIHQRLELTEDACRAQFLLSAVRVCDEDSNLPCCMVLPNSPLLPDIARELIARRTLEAA